MSKRASFLALTIADLAFLDQNSGLGCRSGSLWGARSRSDKQPSKVCICAIGIWMRNGGLPCSACGWRCRG